MPFTTMKSGIGPLVDDVISMVVRMAAIDPSTR